MAGGMRLGDWWPVWWAQSQAWWGWGAVVGKVGELEGDLKLTQGRTEPQALPRHLEQRAPSMRIRVIPKMSFCLASLEKEQILRLLPTDPHLPSSPSTKNPTSRGMTIWSLSLAPPQDKVQKG